MQELQYPLYGAIWNVFAVQHVGESTADAGEGCLEARLDVELPIPFFYGAEIKAKIEAGEVDVAILDGAVLRVLEAKFRMGLFEHPYAQTGEDLAKSLNMKEDEEISHIAAQESITLLKNDGTFPLSGKEKVIAVVVPRANNARYYFGGYAHLSMVEAQSAAGNSMAGVGSGGDASTLETERVLGTNIQVDKMEAFDAILRQIEPDCVNLLDALCTALPEAEIDYAVSYPKPVRRNGCPDGSNGPLAQVWAA